MKLVGLDPSAYKNGKKSSWKYANQMQSFSQSAKAIPLFFSSTVSNGTNDHYEIKLHIQI